MVCSVWLLLFGICVATCSSWLVIDCLLGVWCVNSVAYARSVVFWCFGCFGFYICLHAYCLLVVDAVLGCFLFICGLIVCWFWVGCLVLLDLFLV